MMEMHSGRDAFINVGRFAPERPRIMVVDDDPVIAGILAGALNRGGYDVEVFNDSTQALEYFDRLELDLVVADWIMPGLDGLHLIDAMRTRVPNLPSMLITSYGDHETVLSASQTGRVDVVLSKPFDLRTFLDSVSFFLDREHHRPADRPFDAATETDGQPGRWNQPAEREILFEQVLNSMVDAVLLIDGRGRVVYHNQGARNMFNLGGGEARSPYLASLCPAGSDLPEKAAAFWKPHPLNEVEGEDFLRRNGGEHFYAGYTLSRFGPGQIVEAVLLVVKDLNDRHLLEKEVLDKNRDLETLAITDPLTGCYNRRHLDRRLGEEFLRLNRYRSPLSLIMVDFDHFKLVNDLFGHLTGDKVLSAAARIMAESLRQVDVLARWGGEEFMILLPETGLETGLSVARRLHALIRYSKMWAELTPHFKVTTSLGLVSLPWAGRETVRPQQAMEILDQALYRAKRTGRDRIVRYVDATDGFETV